MVRSYPVMKMPLYRCPRPGCGAVLWPSITDYPEEGCYLCPKEDLQFETVGSKLKIVDNVGRWYLDDEWNLSELEVVEAKP